MSTQDDHIIKEVRRNLHDQLGSRAAVMVGSGFSRNSVPLQPTKRSFPTWTDLLNDLISRLYPEPEHPQLHPRAAETSAALRFAQEFDTEFGRAALIELVRQNIPDDLFQPGLLHRQLLDLPWADVFTTNYDCQLEKASRWVWRHRYSVVYEPGDLSAARAPRIVKLHGSLPTLSHLILTEDDFRKYPKERAPFVNLVSSSLSENSFCLIGFSGTDPNFLAWTGWVRDELREATPPIYLFSTSQSPLKRFQRKLLESRRVFPVNLLERYETADIARSLHLLFEELQHPVSVPTPHWNSPRRYTTGVPSTVIAPEPSPFNATTPQGLMAAAEVWNRHRHLHKGWIVLPYSSAQRLADDSRSWAHSFAQLPPAALSLNDRLFVAHELTWRFDAASVPLPDDFVFDLLDPILKEFSESAMSDKALSSNAELAVGYLRLQCLRHARELGDDTRFSRFYSVCATSQSPDSTTDEWASFLTYQRVLHLLGRLEHHNAVPILDNWVTDDVAPIWSVRKAAIYLECGVVDRAVLLLDQALVRLRQTPVEPDDMQALSTEGCLLYLRRSILQFHQHDHQSTPQPNHRLPFDVTMLELDDRLNVLNSRQCDPIEVIRRLQHVFQYRPKKPLGERPVEHFDIGRVGKTTTWGENAPLQLAYYSIRFMEDAGIPLKITGPIGLNVGQKLFGDAAMTIADFSVRDAIGLVLRSRDEKLIGEFFNRERMAHADNAQIAFLHSASRHAIIESATKITTGAPPQSANANWWDHQFKVACVVIGRIVARLSQDAVREVTATLVPLSREAPIQRSKGYDELMIAIRRSCNLLKTETVSSLLPSFLQVPLHGSPAFPFVETMRSKWQSPLGMIQSAKITLPRKPTMLTDAVVFSLTSAVSTGNQHERDDAIDRLLALDNLALLFNRHKSAFRKSLYQSVDESGMPMSLAFHSWYLAARYPAGGVLSQWRYLRDNRKVNDADYWLAISWAMDQPDRPQSLTVNVSWRQRDVTAILELSDAFVSGVNERILKAKKGVADSFVSSMFEQELRKVHESCQDWLTVLEHAILLSRSTKKCDTVRANEVINKARASGAYVTKILPALLAKRLESPRRCESVIRHGLADEDEISVLQACLALRRIAFLSKAGHDISIKVSCFTHLSSLLLSMRNKNLPLFVDVASDIVAALGVGHGLDVNDLIESLSRLLIVTDYTTGLSTLSFNERIRLRKKCVGLAQTLSTTGLSHAIIDRWRVVASEDNFGDVHDL